jgi:hypothetical protein
MSSCRYCGDSLNPFKLGEIREFCNSQCRDAWHEEIKTRCLASDVLEDAASSATEWRNTLREVERHVETWTPDARLLGNLRAGDVAAAVRAAFKHIAELTERIEDLESDRRERHD